MSTVTIFLRVRPGKNEEFTQTLQSIQNDLKAETGLTKSMFYRDMNDSSTFYLIEEWASQSTMERYLRSERFSVLMGILKVLCVESEIKFHLNDLPLELTPM
jgi:quinol monooxygenase YgiN